MDFSACTACGTCVPACPRRGKDPLRSGLHRPPAVPGGGQGRRLLPQGRRWGHPLWGEVLLQYEVAAATLRLCRTNYLNTCIETSAYAPWDHLWQVAQYCHTVFVDLKHMDSTQHQAMTGVGNGVILDNLTRLCRELPRRGGQGDRPDAPHPRVQR